MKCKEQALINQERKQYNAVDLVKFLCAIMVVMIHIAPFGTNGKYEFLNYVIQDYATRIGVPFFFVASGFFLYKKSTYEEFNVQPSKKYILKILKLYVIWSIIYMPLSISHIFVDEKGVLHGILVYLRNIFFVGSYLQLWYLNATIVGVGLVSFLLYRKCRIKSIIIASAILYTLGLLAQSWFGIIKPLSTNLPNIWMLLKLIQKIIGTTRNGLFEGFLFIAIGMIFAFLKIRIDVKKATCGFVISYLLMFIESFFVRYYHIIKERDMYIF